MIMLQTIHTARHQPYLLTHPLNLDDLRTLIQRAEQRAHAGHSTNPTDHLFSSLAGLQIRTDDRLPRWLRVWRMPVERFWEYETSDELWCRYFGIGHEVETRLPAIWIFGARVSRPQGIPA